MFSHSTAVPYSTKHFCLPVFTSCHDFHFHISFSASTHYALIQFSCTKNFSCSKDLFLMRHPASKSNSRSVCPRPPGGVGGGGGVGNLYYPSCVCHCPLLHTCERELLQGQSRNRPSQQKSK